MSNSEIVTTYHLDNPWDAHPMERDHFYDEQTDVFKKTGKPSRAVGVFNVLLFTEKKEIILQKRSHKKRHNPSLIDKAVGGHIQYGHTVYYTAMVETVQELQVPSVVLRDNENFEYTYKTLRQSLESCAILKLINTGMYELEKVLNDEKIIIANNVSLFFGIYGGTMKPSDREASGILFYELDVLREEIEKFPDLFTEDLKFYLKKFNREIQSFLKILD
jgi:isopentenyldiphosphate isomerase